jgi:hypothetical protein
MNSASNVIHLDLKFWPMNGNILEAINLSHSLVLMILCHEVHPLISRLIFYNKGSFQHLHQNLKNETKRLLDRSKPEIFLTHSKMLIFK